MKMQTFAGQGRCQAVASLMIQPTPEALFLGAIADVFRTCLHAVHDVNRQGVTDDYLAVAFPQTRAGRDSLQIGEELAVLGSFSSLTNLLETDRVRTLIRRAMILAPEFGPVDPGSEEFGTAYYRNRSIERSSAGKVARQNRFRHSKGEGPLKLLVQPRRNTSVLPLQYGTRTLFIEKKIGRISQKPLLVSSYGFSAKTNPAFLPVRPLADCAVLAS